MRQVILLRKFVGALGLNIVEMMKERRIPRRGSGPLGLFKRILAEWQFTQAEANPVQMVASLISAKAEDMNIALSQLSSHTWLVECYRDPLYLLEYLLTRGLKPKTVVETGVANGYSSAVILQALEDNNQGQLYSIDLPSAGRKLADGVQYQLSNGKQVGWFVPDTLRHRWHLILGDASEKLLTLLQELGQIDIFIHDSLHTDKHMMFEYETAWPFIKQGGLLISDDIGVSFVKFSGRVNRPFRCVQSPARHIGGVKK